MTRRLIQHLRGNLVGYVALFIALGGTSYAATSLPSGSVGTRQLRNGAVTESKLSSGIGGEVWATTDIGFEGNIISSDPKGVTVSPWEFDQPNQPVETGILHYPHRFGHNCYPLAEAANVGLTFAGELPTVTAGGAGNEVQLTADGQTAIDVAIVCAR